MGRKRLTFVPERRLKVSEMTYQIGRANLCKSAKDKKSQQASAITDDSDEMSNSKVMSSLIMQRE